MTGPQEMLVSAPIAPDLERELTLQFLVTTAGITDAAEVGALLEASYGTVFADWYDPETLRLALPIITRANPELLMSNTFYLARSHDGRLVGCGGWTPEQPATGHRRSGEGHIRHFATYPGAVRCGIGRAIIETCVRDAAEHRIERLTCYSSLPAEGFYAALGFVRLKPAITMLQGDIPLPSIIMQRSL